MVCRLVSLQPFRFDSLVRFSCSRRRFRIMSCIAGCLAKGIVDSHNASKFIKPDRNSSSYLFFLCSLNTFVPPLSDLINESFYNLDFRRSGNWQSINQSIYKSIYYLCIIYLYIILPLDSCSVKRNKFIIFQPLI